MDLRKDPIFVKNMLSFMTAPVNLVSIEWLEMSLCYFDDKLEYLKKKELLKVRQAAKRFSDSRLKSGDCRISAAERGPFNVRC